MTTKNRARKRCRFQFQTHYRHIKGYEFSKKLSPKDIEFLQEEKNRFIENLLSLSLFNVQIKNTENQTYLQKFKLGLLSITGICWLYILIVSLPNLYLDPFFYSLLETSYTQNPFI